MRVTVTGGSGLVGRRVVRLLAGEHEVSNVDSREPSRDSPARDAARYTSADIRDLGALTSALEGADAVVHAAAIPGPTFGTEQEIFETNVEGTRNVAEAAVRVGVRRIVFISSESVLGFAFSRGRVAPRYFPVNEAHPLAPTEPYGRSKLMAETALARRARAGPTVVSLRPPWVWVPEEYERVRRLTEAPDDWWDGLWAYVHGDDLARAVERALTVSVEPGFHAVYVAAPDNGTVFPTRELVGRYFPDVPLARELSEYASLISSEGAAKLIGFAPALTWREFL